MDRRRFLTASVVGVAATVAGCTDMVLNSETGSEPNPTAGKSAAIEGAPPADDPGNTIEVSAGGEVEVEPDRATLSVGVEASGESAEAVNDELRRDAEALRAAFDELGIPDEHVESGRFDVRQRRRETGYEGTHSFQLELDDPGRVGEVIDATVAAGADDVGRVNFGLQEETRASLRDEAIDRALANADGEARHVAANRGVEITGTRSVTTSDVGVRPFRSTLGYAVAEADDAAAPPTEIDSGPVHVTASVTVQYSFEDPE